MRTYIPVCVSQGVFLFGTAANWFLGKKNGLLSALCVVCGLSVTIYLHVVPQKLNFFLPGHFGPSHAYVGQLKGRAVPNAGLYQMLSSS